MRKAPMSIIKCENIMCMNVYTLDFMAIFLSWELCHFYAFDNCNLLAS